ncbi:MAG: 4-(cytidine 5'-diphospho)-2-C-methyl-D-erythritol kinase [Bacteroidota bacterium]
MKIHLHKVIPIGAGLGGGSADAAFTLKLLNDKFRLNLSTEQLVNYSLRLGSDCPFFIINKPCFATGRGDELLEPVSIDLGAYQFILVNPGISIPTATAFSQVTPTLPVTSTREIILQPVITWKDELKNDFEEVVFKTYPAISDIKNKLYHAGAVYASMSGSGSTVFGLFRKEEKVTLSFPSHYFVTRI